MNIETERFPLLEPFVISRGSRTEAIVITVTLTHADRGVIGRGECTPYPRYGETVESVTQQIEAFRKVIEDGIDRNTLRNLMPAGAARNAIDNALWDLEAKYSGIPAYIAANVATWRSVTTAYTISLGTPDAMARSASRAAGRPLLKIKLGGADGKDIERIHAVRSGAPQATLIADANEAWQQNNLEKHLHACAEAGVAMVEQPLPASDDSYLAKITRPVPICADESVHDLSTLAKLVGLYDLINIKLDKTGGLTEALSVVDKAQSLGFGIMVGCMIGSSLAMAPAMILTTRANFVDLDAPLLLAADRTPPLQFNESTLYPPHPDLWG